MKTRIKKIIIVAAALLFVSSGVSFAHDWNDWDDKPPGKAYGHYKVKKHHPGWNNKHYKPISHHRKRYVYKEVHHHHYYKNHHRRPAPREAVIYKAALKNPKIIFKVIMKEHRLF
jgi:hypothetical protein